MLSRIFDDAPERTRGKVLGLFAILVTANVVAWLWALIAFHGNALLIGTAFLAYSFGLRHAFDADHIAAIDNITRKLMQDGRRPIAVGFFFSLGHSTIVIALVLVMALTTSALADRFAALKAVGAIVGTSLSALFLLAIAAANVVVLIQVFRALQTVRRGGGPGVQGLDEALANNGALTRLLRPAFAMIARSWHAYPLGLLFGLGFDTATEIGLLGIAAAQAAQGLSIWSILALPALFTAGMSLLDMTDSAIMVGTYGWAFVRPIGKLYYNAAVTLASVLAALAIGGIETLALIGERLGLEGPFWRLVEALSDNFGLIGYSLVAFFIVAWLASYFLYRAKGHDRLEPAGSAGFLPLGKKPELP